MHIRPEHSHAIGLFLYSYYLILSDSSKFQPMPDLFLKTASSHTQPTPASLLCAPLLLNQSAPKVL